MPIRTCVGCRSRTDQAELLRVAVAAGQVVADPRRRAPGRGAYVHRRLACVDQAARQGGLARGLKRQICSEDMASLRRAMEQSINGNLG